MFSRFLLLCLASAANARMIFNQTEGASIYTSVGTTVIGSAGSPKPFFAVADGLNAPKFAEIFNGEGALVWSFSNSTGDFIVDTARHADGADNGPVDVFVATCAAGDCTLFGRTSATDTTRWMVTLPDCATDGGGGTYTGFQASDNGNSVAFYCRHTAGPSPTSRVYLIGGQTGIITWMKDLGTGVKAGQAQVQITASGSHVLLVNQGGVPTPNSATAYIFEGTKGVLIDAIPIPFFICAAISDSGDYVAVGDDPSVHVYKRVAGNFSHAYDVSPPFSSGSWIPWDVQISTGPDASELLAIGYISGDVLTVGVGGFALETGASALTWQSKTNPKLQENPTIRADADMVAVSLWGNDGDVPTVVLLRHGAASPLFEYVTPGSMMAVDLNVIPSKTPGGSTTVYLAAAGKHVPANQFGNGGDAFGWELFVPTL